MSDIGSNSQIWLEDFVPGTVLTSPSRLVTIEDIDAWAALTGERHPVHMDDAFAWAASFRGRVTHGLFSLALVEGLKAEIGVFERSVIASLGWNNVKFSAPFHPGDKVHLRLTLSRSGRVRSLEKASPRSAAYSSRRTEPRSSAATMSSSSCRGRTDRRIARKVGGD